MYDNTYSFFYLYIYPFNLNSLITGSFLTISYGFMFGMTPPTLLLYKSEYTPLSNGPLSNDSISWITTYLCMGAAFGAVFFKHLSDCFGRRATLMLAGIIQNVSKINITDKYKVVLCKCLPWLSYGDFNSLGKCSVAFCFPWFFMLQLCQQLQGSIKYFLIPLLAL